MTKAQRWLLFLLVTSVFINYIDRSNLSVAAPPLKDELHLSGTELGQLLSAFFWTYAGFQLVSGLLVDRFNVYWVYGAGFFLWSAATALTGWVNGLTQLVALRMVVGAAESVAYPSYCKILASDIPERHRGISNALIDAGSKMGPALGSLMGGYMIQQWGWRAFFIALGVASLFWLVPWVFSVPKNAVSVQITHEHGPSVWRILRERSAWGSFFGLFCCNYFWFFLLTWLPTYMVKARGLTQEEMGRYASFAFVCIALATLASGHVTDRLIARGASTTVVRKSFACAGLVLSSVVTAVAMTESRTASMVLLYFSCAAFGVFCANHWAMTQTIAGPAAAGKWTGLQNFCGNLAGVAAPWVTGTLYDITGSFVSAFAVAGVIVLMSAFFFGIVIGPVKQIRWDE